MPTAKQDMPVQLDVPGATARQLSDFGTARATLGAENFSLAAGVDLAPLFAGLPGNACQAEHTAAGTHRLLSMFVLPSSIDSGRYVGSTAAATPAPPAAPAAEDRGSAMFPMSLEIAEARIRELRATADRSRLAAVVRCCRPDLWRRVAGRAAKALADRWAGRRGTQCSAAVSCCAAG